jgi:hypothetical protein
LWETPADFRLDLTAGTIIDLLELPEILRQHVPPMPEANDREEQQKLAESIGHLAQQVEMLWKAIDELRELYRWAIDNGRVSQPVPGMILRRMARDPADPQWNEKLEVVHYDAKPHPHQSAGDGHEGAVELTAESMEQSQDKADAIAYRQGSVGEQPVLDPDEPGRNTDSADTGDTPGVSMDEEAGEGAAPSPLRYEEWAATVRDPAVKNSEGTRRLRTKDGNAEAWYEIAPLPGDRWARHMFMGYHCGNMQGSGTPWTEYASRQACVEGFLNSAKEFFRTAIGPDGTAAQRQVRTEMLELLDGGLFGFAEPDPVEAES